MTKEKLLQILREEADTMTRHLNGFKNQITRLEESDDALKDVDDELLSLRIRAYTARDAIDTYRGIS